MNKWNEPSDTAQVDACGRVVGFPVPGWQAPDAPPRTPMHGRFCDVVPLDVDAHADSLHDAFCREGGDADWSYLPYGPFPHRDALAAWMSSSCLGDDPLFHAIIDVRDGRAVGMASYLRIAPAAGSIEVGHIHYSPLLQRTPAATEAMYLMMKRVFELGYRRYEWKCNALNRASRNAALRLGFSFEGVFRQAGVVKGHNRDTAWYACIDAEWPALEQAFRQWLSPDNLDPDGRQRTSLSAWTAPVLVNRG